MAVLEGCFGRRDDPRLIWSQFKASQVFSKKKSQFFWRVDTPLQVFPVHTPVRRGQSGTLSRPHMVPGQLRRDFALLYLGQTPCVLVTAKVTIERHPSCTTAERAEVQGGHVVCLQKPLKRDPRRAQATPLTGS